MMKTLAGLLLFWVVGIAIASAPFMLLWNHAVVEAVAVTRPIDYWTSFLLCVFISAACSQMKD